MLSCQLVFVKVYNSVKLNANHFISWEQNFDLVMPLDRDMIYGNGLGFRIQEEQTHAVIFDTNLVNITLKDQQKFDTQYFFGNLFVGVLDSQQPQTGQSVSVYRCYVKEFTLNYECEFLASTSDCFGSSVLYDFKVLDSFIDRSQFIIVTFFTISSAIR